MNNCSHKHPGEMKVKLAYLLIGMQWRSREEARVRSLLCFCEPKNYDQFTELTLKKRATACETLVLYDLTFYLYYSVHCCDYVKTLWRLEPSLCSARAQRARRLASQIGIG